MILLSRREIEAAIPPLKNLSFPYWALVARIKPYRKRIVDNHLTYFYTLKSAQKLEAVLRKHRPKLFENQEAQS